MARKLTFGIRRKSKAFTTPKALDLWTPKGRTAPALVYVLPHNDFARAAAKHGYEGRAIGGFALYGLWCWPRWQHDRIYLRVDCADLFLHEWQHIETQSDFHGEVT